MKVRKEGRKLGPTESTAPLPAARVEAPGPPRLRGVAVPLAAAAPLLAAGCRPRSAQRRSGVGGSRGWWFGARGAVTVALYMA